MAGLTAAYVLNGEDSVTLFEADSRLGGHAHTHDVPQPDGPTWASTPASSSTTSATYPTLLRLFAELGVETQDSEMSMSIRCDGCGLEYAGARAKGRGIIPRPSTLLRGRYLLMLLEVTRFHRRARALLAEPGTGRGGSTHATRTHPGRVPGPGEVQPLLHLAFHDPRGQRRLVL